jgi:hypothetical protein
MVYGAGKILALGKSVKKLKKSSPLTRNADQELEVMRALEAKRAEEFIKIHNKTVDDVAKRNKATGTATSRALNLGTNDAPQRIGLSLANKGLARNGITGQIDQGLEPLGLSSELAKGIKDGLVAAKSQAKGLPPEKYVKPTFGTYRKTVPEALGTVGNFRKALRHQAKVEKRAAQLAQKKKKLHEASLAVLEKQKGGFKSQSERVLAIKKTEPPSNISRLDIEQPLPGPTSILPDRKPEKLPVISASTKTNAENLPPQQRAYQEMAERDQRILKLDEDLRKQDPKALQQAVRERDYYQVQAAGDLVKGVIATPLETAIVASNTAYKFIPKAKGATPYSPYLPETVKKAEYAMGESIGTRLGGGNVEKMLQSQVKVETSHAAGRETARELRDLHKQRVLEVDRNLLVDKDGDKFFDTFQSGKEIKTADKRYETTARQNLPRPEDSLYLESDIVPIVPQTFWGGISRPLNAWLKPPV